MGNKKNKDLSSIKDILEKQGYAITGNHSAVQICKWTKTSLNNKGVCWKEKFYGIKSHKCCQFSPSVMWCENSCLHCWRPIELNLDKNIPKNKLNNPKEIIDGIIKSRAKLLMGFKGNKNINYEKFKQALKPSLFTFSLSGEPSIYPYLGEMFKEIRKRKCISFLVTNGLNPETLKKLEKQKALPTQLTISLNAPNKTLFDKWHNSRQKNAWEKFNKSLEIMKTLKQKTRRALRFTLVKKGKQPEKKFNDITNMSFDLIPEYVNLIKKAEPDFIHVKGFKSLGWSRNRFDYDKQPMHYEIKNFTNKLVKQLKKENYKILGEDERSCVFVLGKSKKQMKITKP